MATNCGTLSNSPLECLDKKSGVKELYIGKYEDRATVTIGSSGQITAMTMASGKQFFTFSMEKEDASLAQVITSTPGLGYTVVQTVTFTRKWLSAVNWQLITNLLKQRLMIIVKDENDNYWLFGYRGGFLTSATADTGQTYGDAAMGHTLTFTSNEPEPAYLVSASLISTLTSPA